MRWFDKAAVAVLLIAAAELPKLMIDLFWWMRR